MRDKDLSAERPVGFTCFMFPSPCGVRRVRDTSRSSILCLAQSISVSVPLRGKEGAGLSDVKMGFYRLIDGFRPLAG